MDVYDVSRGDMINGRTSVVSISELLSYYSYLILWYGWGITTPHLLPPYGAA